MDFNIQSAEAGVPADLQDSDSKVASRPCRWNRKQSDTVPESCRSSAEDAYPGAGHASESSAAAHDEGVTESVDSAVSLPVVISRNQETNFKNVGSTSGEVHGVLPSISHSESAAETPTAHTGHLARSPVAGPRPRPEAYNLSDNDDQDDLAWSSPAAGGPAPHSGDDLVGVAGPWITMARAMRSLYERRTRGCARDTVPCMLRPAASRVPTPTNMIAQRPHLPLQVENSTREKRGGW